MLKNPLAVAIDSKNRIYVGDYLNHRIGVYELVNTKADDSFLNPPPNPVGEGSRRRGPRGDPGTSVPPPPGGTAAGADRDAALRGGRGAC